MVGELIQRTHFVGVGSIITKPVACDQIIKNYPNSMVKPPLKRIQ